MHAEQTAQQALDALDACRRELARAHEMLVKHVPGDEAARVARIVEFEVPVIAASCSTLRKVLGNERADERAESRRRQQVGEAMPDPTPVGATP